MTIFMAILWPVLFLASITISLVSWFKLRQQSDKVYFSVKGWVLVAYIAFVGMLLAYAPLAIRYVGWLLMLDAAAIIFFVKKYGNQKWAKTRLFGQFLLAISLYCCMLGLRWRAVRGPT